jgi:hypothetical protein
MARTWFISVIHNDLLDDCGSTTAGPRGPTPSTDGGHDAVVPFKCNVRPEPQEEHITGRVHTITPVMADSMSQAILNP